MPSSRSHGIDHRGVGVILRGETPIPIPFNFSLSRMFFFLYNCRGFAVMDNCVCSLVLRAERVAPPSKDIYYQRTWSSVHISACPQNSGKKHMGVTISKLRRPCSPPLVVRDETRAGITLSRETSIQVPFNFSLSNLNPKKPLSCWTPV